MINVISGVTGQTGSYLAELLLDKGEKVIGFSRRTSVHSTTRIDHLLTNPLFTYVEGDLTDQQFIWKLIADYKPDRFYNLAAMSHVHTSFTNPGSTFEIDTLGVLNVLEAIRTISPETRFYQASTSEMFGSQYSVSTEHNVYKELGQLQEILTDRIKNGTIEIVWDLYMPTETETIKLVSKVQNRFQDENTPMIPNSPYAIAKLGAHHLVRLYRESYGLKCCSGILFNHESPRRGDQFVTQKIIKWIGRFVKTGCKFPKLALGNLNASRDWGHAKDYAEAIHLILNADKMDEYVVATGETHTIREFLDEAFSLVGIEDWSNLVVIDPKFIRPSEVPYLCGKADKIKKELGWTPKTTFKALVKDMYEAELRRSSI